MVLTGMGPFFATFDQITAAPVQQGADDPRRGSWAALTVDDFAI